MKMATTEHLSLLGLPAELRVRIYRHLFQDSDTTTIRLTMTTELSDEDNDVHTDFCKPTEANRTSIDTGITLICRLLREESLPVLQEKLTLSCILDANFQGPGRFNIKPQYIQSIRKAEFLFCGDRWAIPYRDLTSLEEIYFEYWGGDVPLDLAVGIDTLFEWATAWDVEKLVAAVKRAAWLTNFSYAGMDADLSNADRGFKIVFRDYFESCNNGDSKVLLMPASYR